MSSNGLAIRVRGLSKAYTIVQGALKRPSFGEVVMDRLRHPLRRAQKDTFWALKDISFDVAEGDVVGVIGRNGAGKSTLLKILSRITDPTGGRIELYGNVGSLLEVGTGFHPELTGRENIYLNGSILGMGRPEIRRQFDAIVDFAEVAQFIDTPVKRYSSGMYVRLAFAVAAHLRSDILIVDEVLAVGDMEFQKKCLGKMKDVAVGGRTVIFVSHNLRTINELCRSAVLLANGRVVSAGDVQSCVAQYITSTRLDLVAQYNGQDFPEHGNQQVVLVEATILNANQQVTHSLRFGEPFTIAMQWNNRSRIKSLCYVVRITDAQDALVCAVNSIGRLDAGADADNSGAAACSFVWNALVPGRYKIELTAWQRPGGKLGGASACLVMEVDATAYDAQHRFNVTGNPMLSMKTNWNSEVPQAMEPVAAEWGPMPELTQRVARFVRNGFKRPSITNGVEGWLTEGEAQALLRLARVVPADQAIVEIGSYRGRSTVVLARGSMEGLGPRVYAIDPHDSFRGINGAEFGPQDQEALYRNILEHGAAATVAVICLPSLAAATGWPNKPVGLLWLDGDHSYDALSADVREWTRRLAPGATVAFHDANLQSVGQVLEEFRKTVKVLQEGREDNLVWLKLGAS